MKRVLYLIAIICLFSSCRNLKYKAYEYEIETRNNNYPFVPSKYISYRNILIYFNFKRQDSTVYDIKRDSSITFTKLDSAECWIFKGDNKLCYEISSFSPMFTIIKKDSLKNMMEGGGVSEYVFDKPLEDTVIDGMQYYFADSASVNEKEDLIVRYFFIKNSSLNTIYSFSDMRYKDQSFKYAGFTLDDFKNKVFFTNLIFRLKEADETTLKLCELIYKRLSLLQR